MLERMERKKKNFVELRKTDFSVSATDQDYKFSIGSMTQTIAIQRERDHTLELDHLTPRRFEVEKVRSNSQVANEEVPFSKSKMSDTYKLSASEFTYNIQGNSKSSQGFLAFPYPVG